MRRATEVQTKKEPPEPGGSLKQIWYRCRYLMTDLPAPPVQLASREGP